ncbi:hypothetical protein [Cellulomonas triticagri]|uniref:Alkaline phosphatase family protein n=1 Tax=Cellulomonas triticagri TaxID=2483352 RepID=A0A3M2IYZ9_9CELL|nr:hypothetical protein [Cellulomonas triticagri]RMI05031.1 hypothetical protein EBM89_16740 [Cellulomonas triticagri]
MPLSTPAPTSAHPQPAGRGTAATRLLVAALVALLLVGTGWAAGATRAVAATDDEAVAEHPVLLVGVTGLRWDDLGSLTTPSLWELSREASLGNTVVRSRWSYTCPAAGWLAVSAGGRSDDVRVPDGTCRTLRDPLSNGTVPGWQDYVEATAASPYDSRLGLLGDTVAAAGLPVTGIGPGAAIALSDADGTPAGDHVRRPASARGTEDAVADALTAGSRLVVLDAGQVRDPGYQTKGRTDADGTTGGGLGTDATEEQPDVSGTDVVIEPTRAEQVQLIDERVGAALDAARDADEDVTVLLFSLADSNRRAQLQVAAATGPAPGGATYAGGTIGSQSTRQDGYLQATDITPTLLDALGIRDQAPSGALVGSSIRFTPDDATAGARVAALIDENRHAQAAKPLVGTFYLWWVGANLALYLMVVVGLNGRVRGWWLGLLARLRRGPARAPRPEHPRRVLHGLRAAAVLVAAVPVSTFLANLLPWWRAATPAWALAAVVLGFAALISAIALLAPWWRSRLLGPLGVVAAVTAVVLAVDVATGARLALDSMMGPGSLVAGRFYGFGNPAFALFATAMLLAAVALADPLLRAGRRGRAVTVVAVLGLVAVVINGSPSIGADFGGPPALVPGFAILALLAAGIRLNWRRVLLVLGAGVVTVVGIATLDYLRPADERTHLGAFIETVLDGGLWTVLLRKGQANLGILFGSEQTLLALGGLLLVVLLVGRPARSAVNAPDGGPYAWLSGGAPLRRLATDAPMLLKGLIALGVTLGVGFALNDSGVVIPATGIGLAVPLLAAACATWMLGLPTGDPVAQESLRADGGLAPTIPGSTGPGTSTGSTASANVQGRPNR